MKDGLKARIRVRMERGEVVKEVKMLVHVQ